MTQIADNDTIHKLAIDALKLMLSRFGPDHTFPTDAIWEFLPQGVTVLSTKKPHQPKRLVSAGYLEATGAQTKALSGPRAGSPTTEYRFGPALVGRYTPPSGAPSPLGASVSSGAPTSYSQALRSMQAMMDTEGYIISGAELANFFLAMCTSPMVVLLGISGTGKSLLPRLFSGLTNSKFWSIPVQPQWSDNSDLLGYAPSLAPGTYAEGKLIGPLLAAHGAPEILHIVLLDEINLAPVEHYFSDFLSVSESRRRAGGRIRTDVLPIELPASPAPDQEAICDTLREIELPPNLRVIGTANMDETTHPFSPKVLDRAFTIEFDDPDLTAFSSGHSGTPAPLEMLAAAIANSHAPITIKDAWPKTRELFEHVAALLAELQDILSPAGIKFGYRTRDSILMYLHFWHTYGLEEVLSGPAALDLCILQKILPKVSGTGEALGKSLSDAATWLEAHQDRDFGGSETASTLTGPLERSWQKVTRMLALLETDGATRYWSV